MVKTASKMLSAISFGVFWRFAPSTIEIIRSRKLSPGMVVTRIAGPFVSKVSSSAAAGVNGSHGAAPDYAAIILGTVALRESRVHLGLPPLAAGS